MVKNKKYNNKNKNKKLKKKYYLLRMTEIQTILNKNSNILVMKRLLNIKFDLKIILYFNHFVLFNNLTFLY